MHSRSRSTWHTVEVPRALLWVPKGAPRSPGARGKVAFASENTNGRAVVWVQQNPEVPEGHLDRPIEYGANGLSAGSGKRRGQAPWGCILWLQQVSVRVQNVLMSTFREGGRQARQQTPPCTSVTQSGRRASGQPLYPGCLSEGTV